MNVFGTTSKKITHLLTGDGTVDACGYASAACGKWIRPIGVSDRTPEGARLCKQCEKKLKTAEES